MKKYITIAALLAAGSAFANAEFDVTKDASYSWDFSKPSAVLGGTWTTLSAFNTTTEEIEGVSTTVLTSGAGYELGTSVLYDMISAAMDGDGVVSFGMKLKWDGTDSVDTILHAGKVETGITLGVTSNGKLTFAQGNAYNACVTNSAQLTAGTWHDVSFSLEKNGAVLISIDGVKHTGTTLSWGEAGGTAGSGMNWDSDSSERNKYSIGGKAPGFSATEQYALAHTSVANLNVVYTAAIPEPSAFGMLAGLGALALVASRRRRR